MNSWLALIASAVIGGMVLLWFNGYRNDVQQDSYLNLLEDLSYDNLEDVTDLIEYDFSRIGLGINDPRIAAVLNADSTDFTFQLDADGNGVFETMRYYLSDTSAASYTLNPRDRILFRVDNGGAPEKISSGLTDFKITYYNEAGSTTTDLSAMRSFGVRLAMEHEIVYDNKTPMLAWESRITPSALTMY
jgi:hypothetical protein